MVVEIQVEGMTEDEVAFKVAPSQRLHREISSTKFSTKNKNVVLLLLAENLPFFVVGFFGALVGRWLTFLPSAVRRGWRMVEAFLAVQSEMEAERAFGLASRHIAA